MVTQIVVYLFIFITIKTWGFKLLFQMQKNLDTSPFWCLILCTKFHHRQRTWWHLGGWWGWWLMATFLHFKWAQFTFLGFIFHSLFSWEIHMWFVVSDEQSDVVMITIFLLMFVVVASSHTKLIALLKWVDVCVLTCFQIWLFL